jgi:hypothetical protein
MGSSESYPTSLPPPRLRRGVSIEVYIRDYSSYFVTMCLKTALIEDCKKAGAVILGDFEVTVAKRNKEVVAVSIDVPVGYN